MTAQAAVTVSWDQWRAYYDEWTVEDQRQFYDWVFSTRREQRRFDDFTFGRLLDLIGRPVTVVELGGWDGEFAATVLAGDKPVTRWSNYEISAAAVAGSVCDDPRYRPVALDAWYWEETHVGDVFVASHVLEHLTFRDVRRTLDASDCRWLFLQVPVADGPTSWDGYHGSHILEVGWTGIEADLEGRGYRLLADISRPGVRCYERGPL